MPLEFRELIHAALVGSLKRHLTELFKSADAVKDEMVSA